MIIKVEARVVFWCYVLLEAEESVTLFHSEEYGKVSASNIKALSKHMQCITGLALDRKLKGLKHISINLR